MSVSASDMKFRKSEFVSDTDGNGGRKGYDEVVSGLKHNLFPRVTKAERTNGVERFRKAFLCNENAANETAYDALVYLEAPSTAGDSIGLASGTPSSTKVLMSSAAPLLMGCGFLHADVTALDTSVQIDMEDDVYEFPNGGKLHISDKVLISQVMDTNINAGDSVTWSTDKWIKAANTTDIEYPNGIYLGSNKVLTSQGTTNEEWADIAENLYSNENVGTGDGTTSPTLSALNHATNGICRQVDKRPVLTAPSGGGTLTINVGNDGTCSGDCSAGKLNMSDGTWDVNPIWTGTITLSGAVLCTYREKPYSYSGNVATVELETGAINSYDKDNSTACPCLEQAEIVASSSDWDDSDTSAGEYNEATYPVIPDNEGSVDDTFTLTFTSATAFTCSGVLEGSLGTGSVSADFVPLNPETGTPYFTIDKDGWGGTWQSGDTVVFSTASSSMPIWMKETVPSGTTQDSSNAILIGYYCE